MTTGTSGKVRCRTVAKAFVAPKRRAPKAPRTGDQPPKITMASAIQPSPLVCPSDQPIFTLRVDANTPGKCGFGSFTGSA